MTLLMNKCHILHWILVARLMLSPKRKLEFHCVSFWFHSFQLQISKLHIIYFARILIWYLLFFNLSYFNSSCCWSLYGNVFYSQNVLPRTTLLCVLVERPSINLIICYVRLSSKSAYFRIVWLHTISTVTANHSLFGIFFYPPIEYISFDRKIPLIQTGIGTHWVYHVFLRRSFGLILNPNLSVGYFTPTALWEPEIWDTTIFPSLPLS